MAKAAAKTREAKTRETALTGDVLPAEHTTAADTDPTVALIETDKPTIISFLSNLKAFMRRASELEKAATDLEAESKLWKAPTNGAEDAVMQLRIKTSNGAKKTAEDHWGICQAVSQFHRKLTAKRGITVTALETAATRAQNHHNVWVDNERRRVEREQALERAEAEARERAKQEADAQALEQRALDAEANLPTLSEREQQFVELVANGFNGPTTAARSAGFKDPEKAGERLMKTPKIVDAIEAKKTAAAARRQAEAVRQQPLDVQVHSNVTMDVKKVGSDRNYHRAELLDAEALIEAVIVGKYGIPHNILQINQSALNGCAKDMGTLINKWPGVRYVKDTKTV